MDKQHSAFAGISSKVAGLLSEAPIGTTALRALRNLKPHRQLQAALLMLSANDFTIRYASALRAATKVSDLVVQKPSTGKRLSSERIARLEQNTLSIDADYKNAQAVYGSETLALVFVSGFLRRLISKSDIERFLEVRYPGLLSEFQLIVSIVSRDRVES